MAIKKYTNGSWVSASYRKYGTETDAITTLPATVIGDGTPISSYTIKGSAEQTGTPTPENPIYPSECGARTENLVDVSQIQPVGSYQQGKFTFECDENTTYTFLSSISMQEVFVYGNADYSSDRIVLAYSVNKISFNTGARSTVYIRFALARTSDDYRTANLMLTEGSTAPTSYIPYGYKLPITLGSTTTDIYLGEVQSTRRIKKLVLDGTEDWSIEGSENFYMTAALVGAKTSEKVVCSHQVSIRNNYTPGVDNIWISATGRLNFITNAVSHTIADFKAFLAQQYAAGTPVTVWYVLAEPTTGIVNEPLRKIGVYVDSVSGTNLATSGTAQAFDINTTLKPSEVDMTYHGWHEHADTKFTT